MTLARSISSFALAPVACALAMAFVPSASASLPPGFEMICAGDTWLWKASDNPDFFGSEYDQFGGNVWTTSQIVGGVWRIDGFYTSYTTNPSQTNAFVVTNTSGSTQTFTIEIMTPGSIAGPTILFGSITGGLTDNGLNGATFGAPVGSSVYTAMIDGNPISPTLWDAPFSVSTGSPPYTAPLGQAEFNGVPGPGVATSISIVHHFTLTAGDSVTLNSAFVVIPGPGGLAILAGGLLFARRRRR